VHRRSRSPSPHATPGSCREEPRGSRLHWVRDTTFSLSDKSTPAAALGSRYHALAQRQAEARGYAGSAIQRSRSAAGRGARSRWVRDTAFWLGGRSTRAAMLGLRCSALAERRVEALGHALWGPSRGSRLCHLGPRYLTRRCSGRYASAAATVFADSNHLAPGQPRGTRSAAELQVVRPRGQAHP
jgi:hypothetical protein